MRKQIKKNKSGTLKPTGEKKQDLPAKATPGAIYQKGGTTKPPSRVTQPAPVGSSSKDSVKTDEERIKRKKYRTGTSVDGKTAKKKVKFWEDNMDRLQAKKILDEVDNMDRYIEKRKKYKESANYKAAKKRMEKADRAEDIRIKLDEEHFKMLKGIKKKTKKEKKKRYGGSVSYNSSSVRGYSKAYSGMGGEDE